MDTVSSCLFSEDKEQLFEIPKTIDSTTLYDRMNVMHANDNHKNDLSWCDTLNGTCVLLNINTYDEENVKINEYNLQLRNATPYLDNGFTGHNLADGTTVLETSNSNGVIYDSSDDKDTIDLAHCRNSYSTTPENVKRLLQNPPSPLYLNYYECTSSLWNIIFNASGVAQANSALFAGTILAAFMIIVSFFIDQACPGIELPDDEEKVQIMKRLNFYPG